MVVYGDQGKCEREMCGRNRTTILMKGVDNGTTWSHKAANQLLRRKRFPLIRTWSVFKPEVRWNVLFKHSLPGMFHLPNIGRQKAGYHNVIPPDT
jgi:hypothetical protein